MYISGIGSLLVTKQSVVKKILCCINYNVKPKMDGVNNPQQWNSKCFKTQTNNDKICLNSQKVLT